MDIITESFNVFIHDHGEYKHKQCSFSFLYIFGGSYTSGSSGKHISTFACLSCRFPVSSITGTLMTLKHTGNWFIIKFSIASYLLLRSNWTLQKYYNTVYGLYRNKNRVRGFAMTFIPITYFHFTKEIWFSYENSNNSTYTNYSTSIYFR